MQPGPVDVLLFTFPVGIADARCSDARSTAASRLASYVRVRAEDNEAALAVGQGRE
jgi:hypothetical protein